MAAVALAQETRSRHGGTPHWQPLSRLPLIAAMLDGMLVDDEEQERTLLEARPKPHVLDDALVARVRRVFTEQAADFWLYNEQLARWRREWLTTAQRAEIERLGSQLERLRTVNTAILALADELAEGTIERVLAMSDVEAGLAWLVRQAGQPGRNG